MKTSLTNTKEIEDYLQERMTASQQLVFGAELLIDQEKHMHTIFQKRSYELVKLYARRKLRAEIESVHQKLFSEPKHSSFRKLILSIFGKD